MLNIYSIFSSIDGEVNHFHQGRVTTFIRMAGCNLNCAYCDTRYARRGSAGRLLEEASVIKSIEKHPANKVTITGGEPLLQRREVHSLAIKLNSKGYIVSVETNGSFAVRKVPWVKSWVVDFKLPSSGMFRHMNEEAFEDLDSQDFVKFVIQEKADFEKALEFYRYMRKRGSQVNFAFSPVVGSVSLPAATLIEWLQKEKVPDAILNLQIHKLIWSACGESEER